MNIDENANVVNCEFAYECPQNWEAMDATENDDVRFCGNCSQNVYFARNDAILQQLITEKKCVAVLRQAKSPEVLNNSQPPGFPRVTAGIPVTPEHLRGKDNFTWPQPPESLPKDNKIIPLILGGIIGLIIVGVVGFFIVRFIFG